MPKIPPTIQRTTTKAILNRYKISIWISRLCALLKKYRGGTIHAREACVRAKKSVQSTYISKSRHIYTHVHTRTWKKACAQGKRRLEDGGSTSNGGGCSFVFWDKRLSSRAAAAAASFARSWRRRWRRRQAARTDGRCADRKFSTRVAR